METYTGMSAVADRSGFLAVYPSAVTPHPFWNYYLDPNKPNDIQFISDLIDHIEATRCVDPKRVYVTGVSNGGGMTALDRLQAEHAPGRPSRPSPAATRHLPPCNPDRPLSVLEIHGTADKTVPYWGTGPDHKGGAQRYVREWAKRDGCEAKPTRTQAQRHGAAVRLEDCACPGFGSPT